MKRLILLLIILLGFVGNAQNAQEIINALKKDLKSNPDDKKRAIIYSDLTWYYSNISLDSAMTYGNKAIIESTKLKDSTLIAQVYSDLGAVYYKKGNYSNSEKSYLLAYKIRKLKKDLPGIAKINANLANVYQTQEKYVPAIKSYLNALEYFQKTNNDKNINITKANIANLFFKIRSYKKALTYVNESIIFQEKNKLNNDLCKSYITKGNIQLNLKDTLEAKKSYDKGLKYCNEIGDKLASSSIYNNLGIIKTYQNKSIEANKLFKIAKTQRDLLNSDLSNAKLQLNFVEQFIKEKKYPEAEKLLINLNYVFAKKDSKINLLSVYKLLIPVYANLNKPDSVDSYINKYSFLLEQLLQKNISQQTAELETKYQTEKKEKQIIAQQAEAKQKNIYLIGISVLALLISLVGFLIYKQQKQKNQQIVQENELKSAIAVIENQNKL
ncbi:MAG: tetratricopeptide repeat protein, partial [Flavobacterium sp.]|nr:tetratricopeptide repeat protein [Flavobacterium sp.]